MPLWDKGQPLDALVHRFTVGDDPVGDLLLLPYDCAASAAHARMLHRIGLLSLVDLEAILRGLREIRALAARGEFRIQPQQEDCHTAIEEYLTGFFGDAGRRLHTGRSRNDQVATAMRMYLRAQVGEWMLLLGQFVAALLQRIDQDGGVPLPGYTHMQPAMPSSVGQWLHAQVEAGLDQLRAGAHLLERLDRCPLGSGAGFGVPLPLDRAFTAELLGFAGVQRSAVDVQNGRGRGELYAVRLAVDCGALLEKLAWDLLLFTSAEYGFCRLPDAFTTGSSIMPQKRNPDVLELLRGRAGRLRGRQSELEWIAGKLPSNYHRDLQLTKEPVFRAAADIREMLMVAERVVALLELKPEALAGAMRPELYATQAAYRLVQQGVPFREAYRQVGRALLDGDFTPPPVAPDAAGPEIVGPSLRAELQGELAALLAAIDARGAHYRACEAAVLA